MVAAGDPSEAPGLVLDMARLGSPELSGDNLVGALRPLVDGYNRWLNNQATRLSEDPEVGRFRDVAGPALDRARDVAERLGRAIELLRVDPIAREAFRFANQAMALQRVRTELVRRRDARILMPTLRSCSGNWTSQNFAVGGPSSWPLSSFVSRA